VSDFTSVTVRVEGAQASEAEVEEAGSQQIEAAVERAPSASLEMVHGAVALGLRVLGGKQKDTGGRASIYRLKRINNGYVQNRFEWLDKSIFVQQ
jgi:hypothetical protein